MVNINFTFLPGVTINQVLSFEMAGKIWSQFLTDDITVDITVAATDRLPLDVLGGSLVSRQTIDLATVETAFQADASSTNDAIASSSLGQDGIFQGILDDTRYQGDSIQLTQAQFKALGIPTPEFEEADGTIYFNSLKGSEVQWDYGFDRSAPLGPKSVDHLSVALHEIGHVLGFVSGLDKVNLSTIEARLEETTLLDLFRYSEQSALSGSNELTLGGSQYFSLDEGVTSLAQLSSGIINIDRATKQGYQASHWGDAATTADILIEESGLRSTQDELFRSFESIIPNAILTTPNGVVRMDAAQSREINDYFLSRWLMSELVAQDNGADVGILDPTLAIEERSNVSNLDLAAFDVLGYDLNSSVDAAEIDYVQILEQAKQTVSELSGLTREELQAALAQDLEIHADGQQNGTTIQFDDDVVYERRRARQRVTDSASFWQEIDGYQFVQSYGSDGQKLLPFDDYLNGNGEGLSSLNAEGSTSSYSVITGNDSDVIEAWQGQVTVKTGLGNDVIVLGNKARSYMADAGDQDFVLVQDWHERDFLILHGDRSQYKATENSLFYQDDLIARFEGGIPFNLDSNHVAYTDAVLTDSNPATTRNTNDFFIPAIDLFPFFEEDFRTVTPAEIIVKQFEFLNLLTENAIAPLINATPEELAKLNNPLPIQDTLNGGMGKDIILGSYNHELIYGRLGDDVLTGSSGNDTLFGQNGDDLLNGTDSIANGLLEKDILIGGKGADTFILGDEKGAYYSQTQLKDQAFIKDFSVAEDRILLHGRADSYQFNSVHNGVEILFEGDRIALLHGIQGFPSSSEAVQFT